MNPWNILGRIGVGLCALLGFWMLLGLVLKLYADLVRALWRVRQTRSRRQKSLATEPEPNQRWCLTFEGQDYTLLVDRLLAEEADGCRIFVLVSGRPSVFGRRPPDEYTSAEWNQLIRAGKLLYLYTQGQGLR